MWRQYNNYETHQTPITILSESDSYWWFDLTRRRCAITAVRSALLSQRWARNCRNNIAITASAALDMNSESATRMKHRCCKRLTGGCILTGDGRWHVLIRLIVWIFFSLILYRLSQSHWQHWHWQAKHEKDAWQQPVWLHTSRSQTPLSVFRPPLVVFAHLPLFFTSHCLTNSLLKEGFARLKQALRIIRQRSN